MDRNSSLRMLREDHAIYTGKSENEAVRIKGNLLAGFGGRMPAGALPFVLEELQNARHPYLIAAAAYALRGEKAPNPATVPYLLRAAVNLAHGDELFSFDRQKPASALHNILETLRWYGAYAKPYLSDIAALKDSLFLDRAGAKLLNQTLKAIKDDTRVVSCCDAPLRLPGRTRFGRPQKVGGLILEDQDGESITYGRFFSGKPAVIAFFYTRCDNPDKCSLTVTRLAQLQKLLGGKAKIAAFTYDAAYDEPHRLKNYGLNRRLEFNADVRCFRVQEGFAQLRGYLGLGVNYIGPYVNKHAIELYILDSRGKAAASFSRVRWDNDEVIKAVDRLLLRKKGPARSVSAVLLSAGMAFFPKCPLCVMAYLGAFGISGMNALWISTWLFPIMAVLFGLNTWVLWLRCRAAHFFLPLYLSSTGMGLLIGGHLLQNKPADVVGLASILAAALANTLGKRPFYFTTTGR